MTVEKSLSKTLALMAFSWDIGVIPLFFSSSMIVLSGRQGCTLETMIFLFLVIRGETVNLSSATSISLTSLQKCSAIDTLVKYTHILDCEMREILKIFFEGVYLVRARQYSFIETLGREGNTMACCNFTLDVDTLMAAD